MVKKEKKLTKYWNEKPALFLKRLGFQIFGNQACDI